MHHLKTGDESLVLVLTCYITQPLSQVFTYGNKCMYVSLIKIEMVPVQASPLH